MTTNIICEFLFASIQKEKKKIYDNISMILQKEKNIDFVKIMLIRKVKDVKFADMLPHIVHITH